MGDLQVLLH